MLAPRRPSEIAVSRRERTVSEAVGTMNTTGQNQARLISAGPVAIAGPDGIPGGGAGELNPAPTQLNPETGLPVEEETDNERWKPNVHPIGSRPLA